MYVLLDICIRNTETRWYGSPLAPLLWEDTYFNCLTYVGAAISSGDRHLVIWRPLHRGLLSGVHSIWWPPHQWELCDGRQIFSSKKVAPMGLRVSDENVTPIQNSRSQMPSRNVQIISLGPLVHHLQLEVWADICKCWFVEWLREDPGQII